MDKNIRLTSIIVGLMLVLHAIYSILECLLLCNCWGNDGKCEPAHVSFGIPVLEAMIGIALFLGMRKKSEKLKETLEKE